MRKHTNTKMKRLFSIYGMLVIFLLVSWSVASAKKNAPAPAWPPAQEQQAFTESFYQALDGGSKSFKDFENQIANDPSADATTKAKMLENLKNGKAADGSERKGFRGDQNDPGPQDWSDWNIKTDADGNVTGFEEKDFEAKDTDKDGEISDAEREEWDKKKQEEHEEAGGAPGEKDITPDWDKNNDGKPDPDFVRDCWQCVMPPDMLDECHDGLPGECDSHACDAEEECVEHTEEHHGKEYLCHNCVPKETAVPWCEERRYYSNPDCAGDCDPGDQCISVDIDIKTGENIPKNRTRERGSTKPCYVCRKFVTVEITWIIVIIETPHARYILDGNAGFERFVPQQVMALSKISASPQGAMQMAGLLPGGSSAMGFLSSFASMDLSTMASTLQQGLSKGGKYGQDCFEKDFDQQDVSTASQPPSGGNAQQSTGKKKKGADEPQQQSSEAEPGMDISKEITTGGPVLACGEKDGKKALAVMDAVGRPIEFITQEILKNNPNAITDALQKAQSASELVMDIRSQGIENFVRQKAQSMGKALVEKLMKKAGDKVSSALTGDDKKKAKTDKKKKGVEGVDVIPNDPFYAESDKKEKERASGGKADKPVVVIGSMMKMGTGGTLGAPTSQKKEEVMDYQWGMHAIGFTPMSDPESAWNFVDAQSKNILVAVIDSGMDLNHPDRPEYIWTNPGETPGNGIDDDGNGYVDDVNGWNFLDNNNDLNDLQGHGTFVAGIIAARWNNGVGIAGINPGAVVMPIKVADAEGQTNSLHIFRAIHYAVDNGAKVINISLGSRGISPLEQTALNYARAMGVFVAVAGGNVGENIAGHGPASADGAFAVGAYDYEGTRSTISNWGPNHAVLAPGDRIVSLLATGTGKKLRPSLIKQGYYPQSGTSFSTPMAAATASLLLVQNPELTPEDVEDILQRSADEMYEEGWDGMSGAGKLNASFALQHLGQRPLTMKVAELKVNTDEKDKFDSLDLFGTVRGNFVSYVVEIGKGKRPGNFTPVAGPYTKAVSHAWLARVGKDVIKGSNEWVVQIRAIDADGKEHLAQTLLELK